jgi:hypothetical protein
MHMHVSMLDRNNFGESHILSKTSHYDSNYSVKFWTELTGEECIWVFPGYFRFLNFISTKKCSQMHTIKNVSASPLIKN